MLTLHIVQSESAYEIDGIHFLDEEGLRMYLRAKGVTNDNIMKALEGLVRDGEYTIQQA